MQNALVLNTYREPARTQTVYAFVKRSFDIICSLLLIVLLYACPSGGGGDLRRGYQEQSFVYPDPYGPQQPAIPDDQVPHHEP